MKKVFLISLFSFIIIFSCVKNSDDMSEIGNDDFSLLVPLHFIQPTELQEGSVIHLCEDTADFMNGLSVVVYNDSRLEEETSDLYSYYNFVANNILDETLESGNLESPKDTVINGLKSLIFKTCGESNQKDANISVCFYTGIYEGKKYFYEVTLWCAYDNAEKYADIINQVLKSFKEK